MSFNSPCNVIQQQYFCKFEADVQIQYEVIYERKH